MPVEVAGTGRQRTAGDDVVIQVRVRRANLAALEDGVELGIDHLTGSAIELRLVPRADGPHELEVITNAFAMLSAPDPVAPVPTGQAWNTCPLHGHYVVRARPSAPLIDCPVCTPGDERTAASGGDDGDD